MRLQATSWRTAHLRVGSLFALTMLVLSTGCASLGGMAPTNGAAVVVQDAGKDTAQARAPEAATPSAAPVSPTPTAAAAVAASPIGQTASGGRVGLDSLNPDQTIQFDAPDAKRDLWQRIRAGYGLAELRNPQLVQSTERWYATRPDYVQRMTTRGARYLFHIVEEVERRK
ncbi:MAG: hypothetical protein RL500_736, partial [Pseudomonadota bacterium]